MAVLSGATFTVEDFLALPRDAGLLRYELYDGALHVSPSPRARHALVVSRLRDAISVALPADAVVVNELDLRLGEASVLTPDLMVVDLAALLARELFAEPADVALLVEVESPSSIRTDRVLKARRYAEARIPIYLRIAPDGRNGPEAHLGRLVGAAYAIESVSAGQILRLDGPIPLSFDPADLVR